MPSKTQKRMTSKEFLLNNESSLKVQRKQSLKDKLEVSSGSFVMAYANSYSQKLSEFCR
jgi:hypothetical protein